MFDCKDLHWQTIFFLQIFAKIKRPNYNVCVDNLFKRTFSNLGTLYIYTHYTLHTAELVWCYHTTLSWCRGEPRLSIGIWFILAAQHGQWQGTRGSCEQSIVIISRFILTFRMLRASRWVIPFVERPFIERTRSPFCILPSLSAKLPAITLCTYKQNNWTKATSGNIGRPCIWM